jgi:hypothetical protein
MSTVWLSATETEVYAASLLLSALMLAAADRSGRAGARSTLLVAYLFALAPPLHLSALVAAPAAILLAALRNDRAPVAETGLALGGALLVAAGTGLVSSGIAVAGAVMLLAYGTVHIASGRHHDARATALAAADRGVVGTTARPRLVALAIVTALGLSALAFLLMRARLDPPLNQGNPSTMTALATVIGRRQYDVPGLFPRQAPWWLQVGNLFEYADWQVALGLAPQVGPSWVRTPVTVAFAVLGVVGSVAHRRAERRSWRAMLLLFVSASAGVVAYLNLKAGPSYGYGFLPDDAPREARERDYFFALAFWTWGAWAGLGALRLFRSRRREWGPVGLVLASLPLVLNWGAVSRRQEPEASLPERFAHDLLASVPPGAVLFVAGDNDSYPLWYAQMVRGDRRDVTLVTIPLLQAEWYRDELRRRHALGREVSRGRWPGEAAMLAALAADARRAGRPVAVGTMVEARRRDAIGSAWVVRGLAYVEGTPWTLRDASGFVRMLPVAQRPDTAPPPAPMWVDSAPTARVAADAARLVALAPHPSVDPTSSSMLESLGCAALALAATRDTAAVGLLDSRCNRR